MRPHSQFVAVPAPLLANMDWQRGRGRRILVAATAVRPCGFVVAVADPLMANRDFQREHRGLSSAGTAVMRPHGQFVAVPTPHASQYGLAVGLREEEIVSRGSSETLWICCGRCCPPAG